MSDTGGVLLIVAGALGVGITAFLLRRRLPSPVVYVLFAALMVTVVAGALVVQDGVTTPDWVVAVAAAAVLGPAHMRFLLGPFGPSAAPGTAAMEPV